MDNQFFIKAVLIAVFLIIGFFLVIPTRGARHLAVRRLTTLVLILAAVFAVVFPDLINSLANLLGVGRGTDLLLYGLIVVFIGSSVTASRRYRQQEAQITELARAIAISQAQDPAQSPQDRP
ncbi:MULTISPECIES: DUF2304 domain-containing protein [Mycetocola]|uniref:DUF2304 domain-containing protein n=1 Tax=Mycetocola lacteus TaxID=76637 RepID=A0A3L7AIL5_9MICO|nr:DUF2304 domain-containing protein [Mycetocola lacteus]RLP79815.1 DUF2304 domain-containing protein [Mycetocola lacteus]